VTSKNIYSTTEMQPIMTLWSESTIEL